MTLCSYTKSSAAYAIGGWFVLSSCTQSSAAFTVGGQLVGHSSRTQSLAFTVGGGFLVFWRSARAHSPMQFSLWWLALWRSRHGHSLRFYNGRWLLASFSCTLSFNVVVVMASLRRRRCGHGRLPSSLCGGFLILLGHIVFHSFPVVGQGVLQLASLYLKQFVNKTT